MIELQTAFRLGPAPRVALVGAGGKTALLFALGRAFAAADGGAILTATTHLAVSQRALADRYYELTHPSQVEALQGKVIAGLTLFSGPEVGEGRVSGLDAGTLAGVLALADRLRLPLLVEADGSRQRPLKAPADHEPAIPDFAGHVLVVAGLSGLGRPLDSDHVHRPERFAGLGGLARGAPVTMEALRRVLTHPQGGLKGIPPGARRVVVLNQASTPQRRSQAGELARLLTPPYAAVVIGDVNLRREEASQNGGVSAQILAVYEPVAGVVLAAGEARRFGGTPKQLLAWRGEPMVRVVANTALAAGLSPVVVVTGAHAGAVEPALDGLPVVLVRNHSWREGQSSSVKAALRALPPETGAALFLLVDQPQIPRTLVQVLVERHRQTLASIVAPLIDGQRGNPVVFDRRTFPGLMALEGDTGGRPLFARHAVSWVPWHDPGLTLDVDTPEDYQRLITRAPPGGE